MTATASIFRFPEVHFGLHKKGRLRHAFCSFTVAGAIFYLAGYRSITVGGLLFSRLSAAQQQRVATLLLRFDIGRPQRGIWSLVGVDLRLEIGGPLNEGGGKFRIGSGFGELQERTRLPHEILSAQQRDASQS
jgi:hypothetical protein